MKQLTFDMMFGKNNAEEIFIEESVKKEIVGYMSKAIIEVLVNKRKTEGDNESKNQ